MKLRWTRTREPDFRPQAHGGTGPALKSYVFWGFTEKAWEAAKRSGRKPGESTAVAMVTTLGKHISASYLLHRLVGFVRRDESHWTRPSPDDSFRSVPDAKKWATECYVKHEAKMSR